MTLHVFRRLTEFLYSGHESALVSLRENCLIKCTVELVKSGTILNSVYSIWFELIYLKRVF